jgi:hypothetical protein
VGSSASHYLIPLPLPLALLTLHEDHCKAEIQKDRVLTATADKYTQFITKATRNQIALPSALIDSNEYDMIGLVLLIQMSDLFCIGK